MEVLRFICSAEVVRQATLVFDTLYLTRGFRIHYCFLKYILEPFPKQSFSKINAVKAWINDSRNGVDNRAEGQ